LIRAALLHRARQHRDRFGRWPAAVARENGRTRTKPLCCALWLYAFRETCDTASRWPLVAGPAFVVHDFASGDISPAWASPRASLDSTCCAGLGAINKLPFAAASPTIDAPLLLSSISPLARSRQWADREGSV